MPKQLPKLILKHSDMPDWRAEYEPANGIHIITDNKTNKPVLAIHADSTATLVLALPKLLKFLLAFGLNHPCRTSIDQVLRSCNLELLRKGETNEQPKSEPLAE